VLSNLETNQEKLIQIVLVGQPELLDLIRTPQMAQLDQRVSVRCTLTHLSLDETGRYIYHRLNVAGARGAVRFDEAGVRLIHAATGGVPRLINLTCDRALLAGYSEQAKTITIGHVKQAVAALRGEEGIDARASITPAKVLVSPPSVSRARWMTSSAGIAAIALLAFLWWSVDGAAEFLSFKAALSGSPRAAEQSYLAIAEHHRDSRQRENALLRLAQLHIAKGDARGAISWLDLLFKDYPESAHDAERQFWTARALLANGDTTRACLVSGQVTATAARDFASDFTTMNNRCLAFTERQRLAAQVDSLGATPAGVADTGAVQPAGTAMPRGPDSGMARESTP
jgi:hypothetical protein